MNLEFIPASENICLFELLGSAGILPAKKAGWKPALPGSEIQDDMRFRVIKSLTIKDPHLGKESGEDKLSILDIRAELDDGTAVLIEMHMYVLGELKAFARAVNKTGGINVGDTSHSSPQA